MLSELRMRYSQLCYHRSLRASQTYCGLLFRMSQFISFESTVDDDCESDISGTADIGEDLAFLDNSENLAPAEGEITRSCLLNNNDNSHFSRFLDHALQKYSQDRATPESSSQPQNLLSIPQRLLPLTRQPQDCGLYQVQCMVCN